MNTLNFQAIGIVFVLLIGAVIAADHYLMRRRFRERDRKLNAILNGGHRNLRDVE